MMTTGIGRWDMPYESDAELMASLCQRVKDTTRDKKLSKVDIDDMLAYEIEVNPIAWGFYVMNESREQQQFGSRSRDQQAHCIPDHKIQGTQGEHLHCQESQEESSREQLFPDSLCSFGGPCTCSR